MSSTTFLPSIIIAYFYSVKTYGEYFYSFSVAILVSSASVLIDDKVLKKYYLHFSSKGILIRASIFRTILIACTASLYYFVNILFGFSNPSSITILLLFNAIVLSLSYSGIIELESRLQMSRLACVNFLYSFSVFILFICLSYKQINLEIIILCLILISMIRSISILALADFNILERAKEVSEFKTYDLMRESLPFGIAAVAFMLYSRMDALMINHYLSSEDVAIYSISTQIIGISTMIIIPIQVVAFPKLKNSFDYKIKYNNVLVDYTRLSILMYISLFIFLSIIFWLLTDVLNKEYGQSLKYLSVLFFSGFIASWSSLRSTHIILNKLGNIMLIIQILALMINFFLNTLLIPICGLWGASISTFTAQLISLFVSNLFHKGLRDFGRIQLKTINLFKV